MRTVKIILYILIFLTVVFFGTGLIIKENKYTVTITVNKSISETFQLFNDLSTVKEWIPEFQSIDTVQQKPEKTGSEYRISINNDGQIMTMKERVMAYIEDEKVTLHFDAEGVLKTDDYTFSKDEVGTKVTLQSNFRGKSYILNCIFPYFKGTFRGIDEKYLNNFKAFAEKQ